MRRRVTGNSFLYVIALIVGFSLYLVGGSSSVIGPNPNAPHAFRQGIPRADSGAHSLGTTNDSKNLQVGNFDFITVTPTYAPLDAGSQGEEFVITHIPVSQAGTYADEQAQLSAQGFIKSNTTIASEPAVKYTGILAYADINGVRYQGPAQATIFYVTHADTVYKIVYSYLSATPIPAKEDLLTTMLSTVQFN